MIWKYINKDKLKKIVNSNKITNEYRLALTANNKNVLNDDSIRYIPIFVNGKTNIPKIINNLLSLQQKYHNSLEIKQFNINNKICWFDDKERASLINLINAKKSSGILTIIVWFDETPIELNVDEALNIINRIEQYSASCYNVTQQHLLEIKKLSTLEDCLNYDITKDYPDILNIDIKISIE